MIFIGVEPPLISVGIRLRKPFRQLPALYHPILQNQPGVSLIHINSGVFLCGAVSERLIVTALIKPRGDEGLKTERLIRSFQLHLQAHRTRSVCADCDVMGLIVPVAIKAIYTRALETGAYGKTDLVTRVKCLVVGSMAWC